MESVIKFREWFRETPAYSTPFFTLVCMEAALIVAVSIYLLVHPNEFSITSQDAPLVFLVLLEQAFFTVYMAIQALREESKYIMAVLFIVEGESLYRSLYIGLDQSPSTLGSLLITAFVLLTIFSVAFGIKVMQGMGWKFFKAVGSSLELKKMFDTHQILICLMKLDVQAVFRLIVSSFFYFHAGDLWYPLLILVLEVFWDLAIRISLYQERPRLMNLALVTLFGGLCLNAVQVFIAPVSQDSSIQAVLVLPALLTILCTRTLLLFYGHRAKQNFGQGLLTLVYPKLDSDGFIRRLLVSSAASLEDKHQGIAMHNTSNEFQTETRPRKYAEA